MDYVVWKAGRLQRHGDRLAGTITRGPLQDVQSSFHHEDRTSTCGSAGQSFIIYNIALNAIYIIPLWRSFMSTLRPGVLRDAKLC